MDPPHTTTFRQIPGNKLRGGWGGGWGGLLSRSQDLTAHSGFGADLAAHSQLATGENVDGFSGSNRSNVLENKVFNVYKPPNPVNFPLRGH